MMLQTISTSTVRATVTALAISVSVCTLLLTPLTPLTPLLAAQYRPDYSVCSIANEPKPECEDHALQQYKVGPNTDYLLGFIEFNDEGRLYDPRQMKAVLHAIRQKLKNKPLTIVVFVHGWHHSAAPGDTNINVFRKVLASLSRSENCFSTLSNKPARDTVGIYLGWPAGFTSVPGLNLVDFYKRYTDALILGEVGVSKVLTGLERLIRDTDKGIKRGRTTLTVVGHSFGGAAVYAALHEALELGPTKIFASEHTKPEHTTASPPAPGYDITPLPTLAVLLNPALSAHEFTPLYKILAEHSRYSKRQRPRLVMLSSEADYATINAWHRVQSVAGGPLAPQKPTRPPRFVPDCIDIPVSSRTPEFRTAEFRVPVSSQIPEFRTAEFRVPVSSQIPEFRLPVDMQVPGVRLSQNVQVPGVRLPPSLQLKPGWQRLQQQLQQLPQLPRWQPPQPAQLPRWQQRGADKYIKQQIHKKSYKFYQPKRFKYHRRCVRTPNPDYHLQMLLYRIDKMDYDAMHRDLKLPGSSNNEQYYTTVGNLPLFRTHILYATHPRWQVPAQQATMECSAQSLRHFTKRSRDVLTGWRNDRPGSKIYFDDSVLKRERNSAGHDPVMVVRVDKELMADHNDIDDPRIVEFIQQLVLLSSQSGLPSKDTDLQTPPALQARPFSKPFKIWQRRRQANNDATEPLLRSDVAPLVTAPGTSASVSSSSVARAQFTTGIEAREPIDKVVSVFSTNGKSLTTLYYFTELVNMNGETVTHRWMHDGAIVAEMPFRIGGDRWRVYSSKDLTRAMEGNWQVIVTDTQGDVIRTDSFTYQGS